MSTPVTLLTVVVTPELMPDVLESVDDALELTKAGYDRSEYLFAMSKGGWMLGAVQRLSSILSVGGLEFIGWDPAPVAEGEWRAFLFKGDDIERIRASVRALLERVESRPGDVAEAIDLTSASEVVDALRQAVPSVNPRADDGYGAEYVFAYLKSLESTCSTALAAGCGLVHLQSN